MAAPPENHRAFQQFIAQLELSAEVGPAASWLSSCTTHGVARFLPTEEANKMKSILVTALALTPLLAMDQESAKRLDESAAVFSEVMATPDKGIPQEMLENAHCIVIVPGMK